jgi:hypothetical protein
VGRKAGLSDDKLRAVLSENRTSFNDTERLVIELADAMTDTPANILTTCMRDCESNFPKNN